MSLKAQVLSRLAKILVLVTLAFILPISPAHAGATFGFPVSVNNSALTSPTFNQVQSTLDGTTLVAATNGYLIKSTDTGTTWTTISAAGSKNWSAVAINDSGTVIIAAESGGGLWLSTNSGASFTLQSNGVSTATSWYWLDTNASGSIIIASNQGTGVYISRDTGATWSSKSVTGASVIKAAYLSADGDKAVLMSSGNSTLYTSTGVFTAWTAQTGAGAVNSGTTAFGFSRDGQKILCMRNSSTAMARTQNFGATWETVTAPTSYAISMATSDDMSTIWLAPNGASSYYSTDYGATWTTKSSLGSFKFFYISPNSQRWIAIYNSLGLWTSDGLPTSLTYRPINLGYSNWYKSAMSTDGSVIAAASNGGEVSTSRDGGTTWTSNGSIGRGLTWNCLAVSGDGNVIYAGAFGAGILKSTNQGQTFTTLTGTGFPGTGVALNGCTTNNDGSKFAFIAGGGGVYYSANGGTSATLIRSRNLCGSTYEFLTVAMTNDGSKFATTCATNNTYVFVSSNGGTTWETTTATAATQSRELKASADGRVLIATYSSTAPKVSTDWGATWSTIAGVGTSHAYGLSINSDGSLIVLGQASSAGNLYYSMNRGSSFTQASGLPVGYYSTAALSGDSTKLLVGIDGALLKTISVDLTFPTGNFASLGLNTTPSYRGSVTLTATLATAGTDGKVTFFANGKRIPGCIKVSSSALVATCTWKPSSKGSVTLSATSFPTDQSYSSGSISVPVAVGARTGLR
jgi:hypothetical protein